MSREVEMPELNIGWKSAGTYLSGSGSVSIAYTFGGHDCVATQNILTAKEGYATLKDAAKNALFPNSTAHPVRIKGKTHVYASSNTQHMYFQIGDGQNFTDIASVEVKTTGKDWNFESDAQAVRDCTKNSVLRFHFLKSSTGPSNEMQNSLSLIFSFMEYDLAAGLVGGGGTASVSQSTAYEGDSATWNFELNDGSQKEFLGWYSDSGCTNLVSTANPYTASVSGDTTLYAKTGNKSYTTVVKYGGSEIARGDMTLPIYIAYNGRRISDISRQGRMRTLNCSGKLMEGDVRIYCDDASITLNCGGKISDGDITVEV